MTGGRCPVTVTGERPSGTTVAHTVDQFAPGLDTPHWELGHLPAHIDELSGMKETKCSIEGVQNKQHAQCSAKTQMTAVSVANCKDDTMGHCDDSSTPLTTTAIATSQQQHEHNDTMVHSQNGN